ncbi:MAG: molybdopterin-binding oxidoreductase [Sphingobacteriales bacterium]|nr:MAG: molybdopterin-binding oxidoreductase [Sphingobacteriales bacterium]
MKKKIKQPLTIEQKIRTRRILSFSVFIVFIFAGIAGWRYLYTLPSNLPEGQNTRVPLRKVLDGNEKVFSMLTLSNNHLAKTFPKEKAVKKPRVNGMYGLRNDADTTNWQLHLVKANGDTITITLDSIKALPKTEIVFDFKCIEGWSQVTHWSGVRFSDFVKHYGLGKEGAMNYVGLITPDKQYYVGIDMPSALHPQTLLCYEMNGEPLPVKQGYPLRLIIPTKYGIKSLKRIGTICFSNQRPKDYWAEQGYDYYSGL